MSLITSIRKDIKAVFEYDPAATDTLEQRLAIVEGNNDEGI